MKIRNAHVSINTTHPASITIWIDKADIDDSLGFGEVALMSALQKPSVVDLFVRPMTPKDESAG